MASSAGVRAQNIIQTVAGTDWVFNADGRRAVDAPLGSIWGVATDTRGNVYFSDPDNRLVARSNANGTLTVIAGNGVSGFSGDGGPARNASFRDIGGLAVDAQGVVYIADTGNYRVRKVGLDGTISTVAGSGRRGYTGDGGPAKSATFERIFWLTVDSAGSLYLSDYDNHCIRKVTPDGIISTVAGTGKPGFGGDGGKASEALLHYPFGLTLDSAGSLYVAELGGQRVRKITAGGVITTFAGDGVRLFRGDGGQAINASLSDPVDVAFDRSGNLYVSSSGSSRIRRVIPTGVISTFAGTGGIDFSGDGGPSSAATFRVPSGLSTDAAGNLFVADRENNRLRRINSAGTISTVAGTGQFRSFPENSAAIGAYLFTPAGLAPDAFGNLLIGDTDNHRIRKLTPLGLISTAAGSGVRAFGGDKLPALVATLRNPDGVAADTRGNIYVADTANNRIRRISPDGVMMTIVNVSGVIGFAGDGGLATGAELNQPRGIVVDAASNIYFADSRNHRIRRVDAVGAIRTVAGNGEARFSGDSGSAIQASLNTPYGLAFNPAGNLCISDQSNHRIRCINQAGMISTLVGDGRAGFSGDGGPALTARLNAPSGIAFDSLGSLYIADTGNNRIRRVDPSGIIATIAGNGVPAFSGDGGPATSASINGPRHIVAAPDGRIYFADTNNDRIRVISPSSVSFDVTPASLRFTATSGGAPTDEQAIQVSSATNGLPFEVSVTTTAGGNWLRADTAAATAPTTVQVSADPSGLSPGAYRGTIVVTAVNANPPSRSVDVTFIVETSVPPRLSVESGALSYSFAPRGRSSARQVRIRNAGGGSFDFTASASTSSGGAWLSVTPSGGAVTAAVAAPIVVTATPGDLATGTYSGKITIQGAATTIDVRVTMTISTALRTILLSQTGLTFTAVQGGGLVPPQTFGVLNTAAGVMDWTVAASTLTGSGWLTATPNSGVTDAASLNVPLVEVGVNHLGLAPGEYYGQVVVSSTAAGNSPQAVAVVLNVLTAGSNPGPLVRPTGLIFTGVAGGQTPGSQTVAVSNLTATPRVYSSGGFSFLGRNFFSYVPANATVAPDQPVRIVVQGDTEGFEPGIRRGVITLLFDDGATQTVNLLQVLIGASPGVASPARAADGCTPTRLLPVFTLLPTNFSLPAAWPNPVEVRIVDDCGAPMTAGAVQVTFSNGDPPLPMISLKDGRWSGTWQARNTQNVQVTVTVAGEVPGTSLRGSAQITGGLRANPNPPQVAPGGVAAVVAPGGLLTIYGSKLSESVVTPGTLPLPMQLAGTAVVLAGQALPLLYASDGQINAMVPFDVAVNTTHQLIVRKGSAYTVPEPIVLAPAQPAIFTRDQTGRGQGLIYSAAGRLADSAAPASAGDVVVIYAAGLGMTDTPVVAGIAVPASPLARVANSVKVTIGGVEAEVQFAGLTPGFTGLYQVNLRVPSGVSGGEAVPVILTVAGQDSPPVTMAVN